MTIDTIKDVLGRIISINKNLTEDSLRNLLVASGWDNNDIEEGLKVYRAYDVKAQSVVLETSVPQVVYTPTPAPTETQAPVISVQTETNFIPTPPPFFAPKPAPIVTPPIASSAPIAMSPFPVIENTPTQTLPIVTSPEHPKTFSTVALVVDIVLFILTLLLLVYVISQ